MKSIERLSIGLLTVSAAVLVFMMSTVTTEDFRLIAPFNSASITQMIERHLQDGRTDLSSQQIPSSVRLLYEEAGFYGIDYRLGLAIMLYPSRDG